MGVFLASIFVVGARLAAGHRHARRRRRLVGRVPVRPARRGHRALRRGLRGQHDPRLDGGGDAAALHPDGGAEGHGASGGSSCVTPLRNAMINPVTIIFLQLSYLISGVVVVETVFAYPGFGRMMLEAALFKDIALIEAGALVAVGRRRADAGPGRPRLHAPRPADPGVTPPSVDVRDRPARRAPARAALAAAGAPGSSGRRPPAGHGVSRSATVGLAIVLLWVAVALLAPVLSPLPAQRERLRGARQARTRSRAHWLGTDHLGRDILARILWGARTVLAVAPLAVLGATLLGALLGLTAGYYRGWVDLVDQPRGATSSSSSRSSSST